MKIVAVRCSGRNLKPGNLFSTVGPEYWDHIADRRSIGEKVWIRTDTPASDAPDEDILVYRIIVSQDPAFNAEWAAADCATPAEMQAAIGLLEGEGLKPRLENPGARVRLRAIVLGLKCQPGTVSFSMKGDTWVGTVWSAGSAMRSSELIETLDTGVPCSCHNPATIAAAIMATLGVYDSDEGEAKQ